MLRIISILILLFVLGTSDNARAAELKTFTDGQKGYSLSIPTDSTINSDFATVFKRFENATTVLEVYFEDFNGKNTSLGEYISYSNKFLYESNRVTVQEHYKGSYNGYSAYITTWKRAKLQRINDDKNYYARVIFPQEGNRALAVFIKSSLPFTPDKYLHSFEMFTPRLEVDKPRNFKPSQTLFSASTQKVYEELFGNKAPLSWGIYEPTVGLHFDSLRENLEDVLKYKFKVAMIYQPMLSSAPLYLLENAKKENRFIELTLFTATVNGADALKSNNDNRYVVMDILNGKYDEWLIRYARALKSANYPVLLRLNNEMNGDWCWYNAVYTALDSELYKKMWIYIHDIMRQEGVDNVIWVWNPHDKSFPNFAWNHAFAYYPGDEYVDVVGMTGYNTGNYFAGEHWRDFNEIYAPLYAEYSAAFDKPFILGEFASSSYGGNKTAWIQTMFKDIHKYPRIKVAVWWNGVDFDSQQNSARIYLLKETKDTTDAFMQGLKNYKSDYTPSVSPLEDWRKMLQK